METFGAVQPSVPTTSGAAKSSSPTPHPRRFSSFHLIIFLSKDQILPANLVRLLLLIAGIEPNPGPNPGDIYICNICQKVINFKKSKSVKCNNCQNWIHQSYPNCSDLKNLKSWSTNYNCQKCLPMNQQAQHPPPPPPPPSPPPAPTYSSSARFSSPTTVLKPRKLRICAEVVKSTI